MEGSSFFTLLQSLFIVVYGVLFHFIMFIMHILYNQNVTKMCCIIIELIKAA